MFPVVVFEDCFSFIAEETDEEDRRLPYQAGHTTGTRLVARSAFDGDKAREAVVMQPVSP